MINRIVNEPRELVIVGASGFGKEVAWLAEECEVPVKGFLDDREELWDLEIDDIQVLGGLDTASLHDDAQFLVAVGNPRVRKKVVNELVSAGISRFATLAHPLVRVSSSVSIGNGSVICAGNVLTVDIKVGNHCHINLSSTVGHDSVIDDFCTIAPLSAISGNVIIKEGVEIGTGAVIRQGVTLESGSMIGMGAVLTKNTMRDTVYIGNPAKKFRQLEEFECTD